MPNLNVGLVATTIVMGAVFPVMNVYAGTLRCTNSNEGGGASEEVTATGCSSGTYYPNSAKVTCTCPSDSSKKIDYNCYGEYRTGADDRDTIDEAYWVASSCYSTAQITYQGCYQILETCKYHASQSFDEYGTETATVNAMCSGYESGSEQQNYCKALCKYSIYQYKQGKTYDTYYCGDESCSAGMFLEPGLRGVQMYYGSYSDIFQVASCYECDYGQYQPNDQYTGSSCLTCAKGYYSSTGASECTLCPMGTYYDLSRLSENEGYPCFPCPEFSEGDVSLGSSPDSSKTLTEQCYVPAETGIQDAVGTFVFSDDCYYEDESITDDTGGEETSSTTTTAE